MNYTRIQKASFLTRPNRFIAHVQLEGETVVCHVKNTGRCRELLTPGATVYLEESSNPARKTKYDLVAVEKGDLLINMDAQAPNQVFGEWARAGHFLPGLTLLQPEKTFGSSRFDFYFEAGTRGYIEVKGVTLEENGCAYFPDAPTERGVKHLEELIKCRAQGLEAYFCFVVQMAGMRSVEPNNRTHPAFGEALRRARSAGVELLALECAVTSESLTVVGPIPILLESF